MRTCVLSLLALAVADVPRREHYDRSDERDLLFMGFLTFLDRPKEGAATAIRELEALGVFLKLITGDSKLVALHVAGLVGLRHERVLTGSELDELHDEALWHARLHPLRPAGSLDPNEVRRLHRAVRLALRLGIERQGASLRDYALPDGASGSMQDEFRAYGREGEPCDRCRSPLAKIRVAGRGTWFCPACQQAPAG